MSTCPRCHGPLTAADFDGVALETCEGCRGQWLGPRQLRDLISSRDREPQPEAAGALRRSPVRGVALARVREDLPCPNCGQVMEPFNYGGDTGIILDKCRQCGGLWLDGGELDKVQEAVEASDQDLDRDAKRFSARLHEIEVREDALEQRDNQAARAPLVLAITNRLFDVGPGDM